MRVWVVKANGWMKPIIVNSASLPETIYEDGHTYYLNSVHRGDNVPDNLNKNATGCWYSSAPSKNSESGIPDYLPPLV